MEFIAHISNGTCKIKIIMKTEMFPNMSSIVKFLNGVNCTMIHFVKPEAIDGAPEDLEKQGYIPQWKANTIVKQYIRHNEDGSFQLAIYHNEYKQIYYDPEVKGKLFDVVSSIKNKNL